MNPGCFWLQMRDRGENMEVDIGTNYSVPWPHHGTYMFKMPRLSPPQPLVFEPSVPASPAASPGSEIVQSDVIALPSAAATASAGAISKIEFENEI
jgi:hypothetical protein